MKEKDKKLLLIDLSARLPYSVKLNCCGTHGVMLQSIDSNGLINNDYDIDEVKPYLFPMSSMTEEQEVDFYNMECDYLDNIYGMVYSVELNWLNKNHFDYHNLIEKGLALDATNLNIY